MSRPSLYCRPLGRALELRNWIDEIHAAFKFYGSRRLTITLQQQGHPVNRKRVQRNMRQMGTTGVALGPNLRARRHERAIFSYLVGGRDIVRPGQVRGIDLVYIRLR